MIEGEEFANGKECVEEFNDSRRCSLSFLKEGVIKINHLNKGVKLEDVRPNMAMHVSLESSVQCLTDIYVKVLLVGMNIFFN